MSKRTRNKSRLIVIILSVCGLLITVPFAVMRIYEPFTLSVQEKNGYEMNWLTQPKNQLASSLKTAQNAFDITGCRHALHGWSADNKLYYGSNCQNDLWLYDPLTSQEPQRISELPDDFESETKIVQWDKPTGPRPPKGIRNFTITFEKSTSPDNRMEAAIIQEQFYGPLDVIVMHHLVPQ